MNRNVAKALFLTGTYLRREPIVPVLGELEESQWYSIAELREMGIRIDGAVKGQGSVEYGEKWLDDLNAIVIDPVRCPNTAREYENIDYQVDKDGNLKAKLEDKDNHSIDTSRYMCERDMQGSAVRLLRR